MKNMANQRDLGQEKNQDELSFIKDYIMLDVMHKGGVP